MNSALATRNLIEAFLQHGSPRRFVNVSSFAVYSNLHLNRGALLDETCPLEDASQQRFDPYGFGKLKQDEIVVGYGKSHRLPYVILPIYAGLERVPDSVLEASGDLGGKSGRTFFSVVLPMLWPSIIAGAIFSFSLSLGDYITVNIVGGANQLLGNLVFTNVGAANNLPLAAAISLIPIAIMAVFLFGVRRTGALNNL